MWLPKQLAAGSIYDRIAAARHAGRVICGPCPATTLEAAAGHFGLAPGPDTYHAIERAEAERAVVELLHRDLAYRTVIMPRERAEELARDFLAAIAAEAGFYSNGSLDPGGNLHEWMSATDADFDFGVIAVSASGSWCVWVED